MALNWKLKNELLVDGDGQQGCCADPGVEKGQCE